MEFLSWLFRSTFSQVFQNCMPRVWVIVTLSPRRSPSLPLLSPFSSSTHQMPLYGAWSHGCVTLHWNTVGLPLAAVLKKMGSCPPTASSCHAHPPLGRDFLAPPLSVLALHIWGLCMLSPPLWAHMRSYHVFSFRKYFSWNVNSEFFTDAELREQYQCSSQACCRNLQVPNWVVQVGAICRKHWLKTE